jgi:hypothetical protein
MRARLFACWLMMFSLPHKSLRQFLLPLQRFSLLNPDKTLLAPLAYA